MKRPSNPSLRLLAPCGIYCGLCSSRNRMPEQARALRKTMADGGWNSLGREVKDFREFWRFLSRIADPEKSCPGCRTAGAPPFCGGPESCEIRECAIKRKVDLCLDCRDWPCPRIERLGRTYVTLIADGRRLKHIGLARWLKEQDARARTGFCYVDLRPAPDLTETSDVSDRVPGQRTSHKDTKTQREPTKARGRTAASPSASKVVNEVAGGRKGEVSIATTLTDLKAGSLPMGPL